MCIRDRSPGGLVPPKIQELTGISTQDLRERGLPKTRVCRDIAEMIQKSLPVFEELIRCGEW